MECGRINNSPMTFKFPPFLLWFLVAAALNPWFSPARAQAPEDYTVSVNVADQSNAAREPALRNAVREIVERVSGSSMAGNARAAPLLGRAASLVKQYSYTTGDKDETQLVVTFDPSALDTELRNLGLPVWGATPGADSEINLRIGGVRTPQAYARALSTLRAQAGVKNLNVRAVGDGALHLQAHVAGNVEKLAVALERSKAFKRVGDDNAQELGFILQN